MDERSKTREAAAPTEDELRSLRQNSRERSELLFVEAQSYDHAVVEETDRGIFKTSVDTMAGDGWLAIGFSAFPTPGPKTDGDVVTYVALMRRGGILQRK